MVDVASFALLHKSANWWSDLVLFVAGLSILIDLFEPDSLRRVGAQARERANEVRNAIAERRSVRNLIYARQDLRLSFIEPKAQYSLGAPTTQLRSKPWTRTPWKEELTREEYLAFWKRVNSRLPTLHKKCKGSHSDVCPLQEKYISEQIDEFMTQRVGAAKFEDVQEKHKGHARGLSLPWLITPVLMVASSISLGATSTVVGDAATIAYRIVLGVGMFVFVCLVYPGLLSAPLWSAAGAALIWSGSLLDRRRPLHPFRIAAVMLFIAGSLFKLIIGN